LTYDVEMATDAGKQTTIWLNNDERRATDEEAARRGTSRSGTIREILAEALGLAAPSVHPAAVDND
jgi:hypothetical protein